MCVHVIFLFLARGWFVFFVNRMLACTLNSGNCYRRCKTRKYTFARKKDILKEGQFFHLRMDDLKLFLVRGIKIGQYSIIARL